MVTDDVDIAVAMRRHRSHRPEERAGRAEMAKRHDLVATGGSDFHGRFKPDISVGVGTGDLEVPDSALAELSARKPDRSA